MLELEGVVKHYQSNSEEVRAVDGINLRLTAGQMLAVHGPSGSGKTTLLLLIAALMSLDAGTIRFGDRNLSSFSEHERCEYLLRDIGFIYQRFRLMPRASAVENAARKLLLGGVGLREAERRVIPWLERVGLGDRLAHPPERLSAGERQRVAIARTLAAQPRLILADEPTGNLDSERSRQIVELLHSIARERHAGVLLVTHDLEATAMADLSGTLRDGKLTWDGIEPETAVDTPSVSHTASAAPR